MSSASVFRFRCVLVAAACLWLAACQRAADSAADAAIEAASGGRVEVERDGGKVVFKTDEGRMTMQGGDALPLPGDFPKDVYLPDGYLINSVMDLEGVSVIGMRAPGKVPGLFADARKAMLAGGWKETMAMQHSTDNAMLAYEKAAGEAGARTALLSFSDGDDAVQMSVQLRRERQ